MRIKITGEVVGRPLRNGTLRTEAVVPKGDYAVSFDDNMGMNTAVFAGGGRTFVIRQETLKAARALGRISQLPEQEPPQSPKNGLTDAVTRMLDGEPVGKVVSELETEF